MSTWPSVPLGNAVPGPKAITDGPFGSHLKTEHYAPTGVRVIRLQNIGAGVFLDGDKAFVTTAHAASLRRHDAYAGDVVVAALGDGARPAGRACVVPDIGPALVKADCFRVRTADSGVDADYLAWYLNSPETQIALASQMRGATRPRVTLGMLKALSVPLPPLGEQRRIAAHLTIATGESRTALDAVEARHADLDVLRRSTITAAFRAASRAVAASLASIGRLTDGDWILTADYAPGGVRLLQVGDVGRGRLSIKSNRHITETRATELNCTLLSPGDLLISRMPEPLGRACVLPDLGYPCITAVDITIMRIDPTKADLDYLTGYLDSPDWYAAVAAKSSGATRPRISRRNLELLPVPLPSLAEQRQIATRLRGQLDEVDRAKAALQAQRAAIDMLPTALLREVFGPSQSLEHTWRT